MTADGRALRLVNVVDEFTREALIMHVGRSITADETVGELEALVARRGRGKRLGGAPSDQGHRLWLGPTRPQAIPPTPSWRPCPLLLVAHLPALVIASLP